jgi:maltose alpha-D-glucosyltransferase/alpha-amylase
MDQTRARLPRLPEGVRQDAARVLEFQTEIRVRLQYLRDNRLEGVRIRVHGDYHLAQVLYTGKDVVIIDFEGDSSRPMSERRLKQSPFRDMASMLDSFFHASRAALFGEAPGVVPQPEMLNALEGWGRFWYQSIRQAFLGAYYAVPEATELLPKKAEQVRKMLDIFLLDRAIHKLSWALEHAPERIRVPSHAIAEVLGSE